MDLGARGARIAAATWWCWLERNWGWLVEELKSEDGHKAVMNEKNGSSWEKPWQLFQENQTAPEDPRDLQLFPNIRSTTATLTAFPLSAAPSAYNYIRAVLQCGEELVSGGQVIICQLLAQENCCASCKSFTVSHKIK